MTAMNSKKGAEVIAVISTMLSAWNKTWVLDCAIRTENDTCPEMRDDSRRPWDRLPADDIREGPPHYPLRCLQLALVDSDDGGTPWTQDGVTSKGPTFAFRQGLPVDPSKTLKTAEKKARVKW